MAQPYELGQKILELEEKVRILQLENDQLSERAEDSLLLGIIAEQIGRAERIEQVLEYGLERISVLKDVPFCACGCLTGNRAVLVHSYLSFSHENASNRTIVFPKPVLQKLAGGDCLLSRDECKEYGISVELKSGIFTPLSAICIPFAVRYTRANIFFFGDDKSEHRLSPIADMLRRVAEMMTSRIDNISLLQELQALNRGLDRKIEERTRELKESENRFRQFFEHEPAYCYMISPDGLVLDVNKSALDVLGCRKEDLVGKPLQTIYAPESVAKMTDHFGEWRATGKLRDVETVILSKRGQKRTVVLNADAVKDDEGNVIHSISVQQDITDRKQAEEALLHLNRQLRAISNCNQMVMRATDEQTLLHDLCRIVCNEAGYRMAWVGFAENNEAKTIRPVAWAGVEDGYLADARLTWADTERGRGPAGIAIRDGRSACIQDFTIDSEAAPWREGAVKRGYRSAIALPLKDKSESTFGVLGIYSTEPNTFTPDEIRLLEELSGDLAFGITVIRSRIELKRAEEALRESEKKVRRKLDAILSPETDIQALELSDIIDTDKIQNLMDEFYRLTNVGIGIIDLHGNVLVGTGWQDICTKFHRVNPESRRLCIESDLELSRNVAMGTFKQYRCKLNMWDIATPIMLGDKHVGNIFLGQFLFDDEIPRYDIFRQQALRYGFNEEEYLAALDRVPRWSRRKVDTAMSFYTAFAGMIGNLSYSNIKLANALEERKRAEQERVEHLRFLECLDQINRAIQGTNDLEQMMGAVLDATLSVLECDRAWLVYPCDPAATTFRVAMERNVPEYARTSAVEHDVPVAPEIAQLLRTLCTSHGPVRFGPELDHPLPPDMAKRFDIQSQVVMAIHPKTDKPFAFGLHQCSHPRVWKPEEVRLFQEIGRRLEDGLSALLAYRNLQDSIGKLEEAQRIAHIGYWDRDIVGNRVSLAGEACRIFGISDHDSVFNLQQWHERWLTLLHPDDQQRVNQAYLEALRSGPCYNMEYRIVRPDGDVRHIHSEANVTRDESGHVTRMLGMMQDVTERKHAEHELNLYRTQLEDLVKARTQELQERTRQLLTANIRLQEADRLKSVFLASMSHELRTPLNSIIGFTGIMLMGMTGELNDEQKKQLTMVRNSSQHLLGLINEVLDIAKIEAGRVTLSLERFDLADEVDSLIETFSPMAAQKGLDLVQEISTGLTLVSDRRRIRQIFMNLVGNSMKFTERGTVKISARIVDSEKVELRFSDTGIGIRQEDINKIFFPFQQIDVSLTKPHEGTGLGLYLCKRLVSLLGGDIEASSTYGKGSEFTVTLPLVLGERPTQS